MTADAPDLGSILLFGVLSLIMLSIGWKRDFFSFPSEGKPWALPVQWFHVVIAFAIYFAVSAVITPIIGKILQSFLFAHPMPTTFLRYASWLNFLNSSAILLCLLCFFFSLPSSLRRNIWIHEREEPHLYREDLRFGILGWILSFPLVLFVNQLLDWFITNVLHATHVPEQLAVYFLKMTFGNPFYLTLAVITIILFAPAIEEILFRGFLQTFIRQHLGQKQAIFITSILFSFFHYSPEQGIANISIIASLFVLSLFIGFVYEKKGSLATPITLHALFNLVNVGNLYFLGGIPKYLP